MINRVNDAGNSGRDELPPPPWEPHTYPVGTTEFVWNGSSVVARVEGYLPLPLGQGTQLIVAENEVPAGTFEGQADAIGTVIVEYAAVILEGGAATLRYYLGDLD